MHLIKFVCFLFLKKSDVSEEIVPFAKVVNERFGVYEYNARKVSVRWC